MLIYDRGSSREAFTARQGVCEAQFGAVRVGNFVCLSQPRVTQRCHRRPFGVQTASSHRWAARIPPYIRMISLGCDLWSSSASVSCALAAVGNSCGECIRSFAAFWKGYSIAAAWANRGVDCAPRPREEAKVPIFALFSVRPRITNNALAYCSYFCSQLL